MAKRFLAIGECLVEMTALGDGCFRQTFSGDTFDTARQMRRALGPGWRVGFLSAVGDDDWSTRMLAHMRAEKIDTDHVARLPGRRPGLVVTEPAKAGPRAAQWRDDSAARALADDPDALEAAISEANALLFSGATLAILAPDARGQLLASLGRAKARGASVAFISNLAPELWPDRGTLRATVRAAARVATIALPATVEEVALFGEAGAEALAERYRTDGCAEIVACSGETLAVWPGGMARLAPPGGLSQGPSGQGAAFNGAYLAARMLGAAPEEAARAALEAAADARHEPGAMAS